MNILGGGIAAVFGAAFGSFYEDGTLIRVTLVPDGVGGGTEEVATESVKVQMDFLKEETRIAGDYAQNEERFIILQSGVTGPLTGDCRLTYRDITYALNSPEQDPARSHWMVRGVPI